MNNSEKCQIVFARHLRAIKQRGALTCRCASYISPHKSIISGTESRRAQGLDNLKRILPAQLNCTAADAGDDGTARPRMMMVADDL